MRTAPNSNPVLTCEYDDGPGNGAEVNYRDVSLVSDEGNDDADGSKTKKRKASGDPKKKNRKDEEDDETERLRKKIGGFEVNLWDAS